MDKVKGFTSCMPIKRRSRVKFATSRGVFIGGGGASKCSLDLLINGKWSTFHLDKHGHLLPVAATGVRKNTRKIVVLW